MQHQIIYQQPERYASFPHLTRAASEALLLVFREAGPETAAAALRDEHAHQDLDSRILFTHSTDEGATWAEPRVIVTGEPGSGLTPSDPGITALRDGRYLARWAQWQLKPRAKRDDLAGPVMRHYVRRGLVGYLYGDGFALSSDGGKTWFRMKSQSSGLASREGVLELRDGTLLLPGYGGYPEQTESAYLLRSWDEGLSWGDAARIGGETRMMPYRAGRNINECSLVALDDEMLLALLRVDTSFHTDDDTFMSEGGIGELAWTLSYDAGFTWAPLQPTGIFGQPGHLLRLQDGSFLVTFGYRRAPFGVRAARVAFSPPGDWRVLDCITLRDDGGGWDIGYPASVQLEDGRIFSVYYIYGEDGLRHIAGTHWTLDEMTPC